jgi:hypothetical protein
MRGNLKLQNATTGVTVEAKSSSVKAQVEVDYVNIGNTVTTPISVPSNSDGNNSFILNSFGTGQVTLSGTVQLGTDAYITVYNTITDTVNVECTNASAGRVIASGVVPDGYDYTLTEADADRINYVNTPYGVRLNSANQLVLANAIYLNGSAADGGTGTYDSPFNKLSSALSAAGSNYMIIVTGAETLSAGTYASNASATDVLIKRSAALTGNMFNVSASGGTVTLSGITMNGRGTDTILNVTAGTLELTGGVKLNNCQDAVNVASGATVSVTNAAINATQYSVKLTDATSIFNLTPSTGTSISGTVYLPTNSYIRVGSTLTALTGTVTIECVNPEDGTVVANVISSSLGSFTEADANKLVYVNDSFNVVVDDAGHISLILEEM